MVTCYYVVIVLPNVYGSIYIKENNHLVKQWMEERV